MKEISIRGTISVSYTTLTKSCFLIPGIDMGRDEEHKLDAHRKLLIGHIISSSSQGKATEKSDVYAFGVVLLELLLRKQPVEKTSPVQCQSLVTWAMSQLTDRSELPNIVDPVIKDAVDHKHLYQVAAVAVRCVQPEPTYRPLITDVLHSLGPLVPVEIGGTLPLTPS